MNLHVLTLWERQCAKTPKNTALIQDRRSLCYNELDQRANRLARHLRSQGVSTEQLVGIAISPSLEMVVAILGILKSGAAFVPLDPTYPKERLRFMLQDSDVDFVITTKTDAKQDGVASMAADCTLIHLEMRENDSSMGSVSAPDFDARGDRLACCLYTSGSTGQPKAVAIEHHALANNCLTMQAACDYRETDCALLSASINYVSALEQLLTPLSCGARVFVRSTAVPWDAQQFAEQVHTHGISVVDLIPSYWDSLLQGWHSSDGFSLVQDILRVVILSGEAVSASTVRLWQRSPLKHIRCLNAYGMTEAPISVTLFEIPYDRRLTRIPIGKPTNNWTVDILNDGRRRTAIGEPGEICICGDHLARGYWRRPEMTQKAFVRHPDRDVRMYRSGDIGRLMPDGNIEYIGRKDQQIKIRGMRVDISEIEHVLRSHEGVRQAVVVCIGEGKSQRLLACVVLDGENSPAIDTLHRHLEILPAHMRPERILPILDLPMTVNGKIDRLALIGRCERYLETQQEDWQKEGIYSHSEMSSTEAMIASCWRSVLRRHVDPGQNFFESGGNSLLAMDLLCKLEREIAPSHPSLKLRITDIFQYPTIRRFAAYIDEQERKPKSRIDTSRLRKDASVCPNIAVVGMACRFPGAENLQAFWENLIAGEESITFFSREDLEKAGVAASLLDDPHYVRAMPVLEDCYQFDAEFFSFTPAEAEALDPQKRMFFETAWHALEDAGCTPTDADGWIGVYAGMNLGSYRPPFDADHPFAKLQDEVYFDKDYLASYLAYKLNLHGPAVSVQTACSTSLVAICKACQDLSTHQCDIALAGGVALQPSQHGYLYGEGGIESPDGRCRPFDADANGTIFGSGVGVVVLKRWEDAVRDGDRIYALVKGYAVNNDGSEKASYNAPSQSGQRQVVRLAQQRAGILPEHVGYIEAHGTGTAIGDPIEVAALTDAFRNGEQASWDKPYCAIGSVKSNIGHLDSAAGVAGFIKTVLSVYHRQLPPSLHFRRANPAIDFANSPFYVNTRATPWEAKKHPRYAGVSSFGIGGTNAHVILREPPQAEREAMPSSLERPVHVLTLSGKTRQALIDQIEQYDEYLERHAQNTGVDLADICFTANVGRMHFPHRVACVASDMTEMRHELSRHRRTLMENEATGGIAFLCTGQGSQMLGMGRELYESQPLFRDIMRQCDDILQHLDVPLEMSLLDVLYAEDEVKHAYLAQTRYAQPALFAISYALARLWQSWGIKPDVLLGHSVGEYAAACIAEVFSLRDGLRLIAARARLMQALERNVGGMLAVQVSETVLQPLLDSYAGEVVLAAYNAPESLVVSGRKTALRKIAEQLRELGIKCTYLDVSHAFHSPLMQPMLAEFGRLARGIEYARPNIPIISNIDGRPWSDVPTADYWLAHIMEPVRFSQGMRTLAAMGVRTFIEVGPKPVLIGLGQQCLPNPSSFLWLPSLYPSQAGDWQQMAQSLAKLYMHGMDVNWHAFDRPYPRRKLSLPLYPFQHRRYYSVRQGNNFSRMSYDSSLSEDVCAAVATVDITDSGSDGRVEMKLRDATGNVLAILDGVHIRHATHEANSEDESPSFATQLAHASGSERKAMIQAFIADCVAKITGVAPADDQSFFDIGMDSLMLTQLINTINESFGVSLSLQVLSNHQTVAALAMQVDLRQMMKTQHLASSNKEAGEDENESYEEGVL